MRGITEANLKTLAGPRSFERGRGYLDAVSGVEVGDGWVTASVGLKQRAAREVRIVPIPSPLVRMLREHLKELDTVKDGRLSASERGDVIAASSYSRAWKQARELALLPE
ncbi:hypothetical protein [Streptomyces mirabilis]|uniref:hypothetical protein n=1 Tax=Streptomyces mirabilis TaxID=68239 RepID=UPI0036E9E254